MPLAPLCSGCGQWPQNCTCSPMETVAAHERGSGQMLDGALGSALLAVSHALEALRYGGVGERYPHNRLILLIESERSKCTGDHWIFWNALSEKLQEAEHELATLPSPNGRGKPFSPAQ